MRSRRRRRSWAGSWSRGGTWRVPSRSWSRRSGSRATRTSPTRSRARPSPWARHTHSPAAFAEGLPLLEQVVADDVRRGVAHASCVTRLGEGYLRAGRLDEALTERPGRSSSRGRTGARQRAPGRIALIGEIAAEPHPARSGGGGGSATGRPRRRDRARYAPARRALPSRPGQLDDRRGRSRRTQAHLEAAARLFTEMGMVFWLRRSGVSAGVSRAAADVRPRGWRPTAAFPDTWL